MRLGGGEQLPVQRREPRSGALLSTSEGSGRLEVRRPGALTTFVPDSNENGEPGIWEVKPKYFKSPHAWVSHGLVLFF